MRVPTGAVHAVGKTADLAEVAINIPILYAEGANAPQSSDQSNVALENVN